MNRRQKIIVSVTGIFIVLLILIGLTYAYFLTRITGNSNPTSISVTTANLELVYGDGTVNILTSETPLMPSSTPIGTKDFTVTNNGDDSEYVVVFEDVTIKYAADTVINGEAVAAGTPTTFESNDFVYTLTCVVKDKNGNTLNDKTCDGLENEIFPMDGGIVVGNSIDKDDVHSYVLTLYYLDNGLDQSNDMNKTLNGKVNIKDIKSINPYSDNENNLAYNIISNSMLAKNGTELLSKPLTTPAEETSGVTSYKTTGEIASFSTEMDDVSYYANKIWYYYDTYTVDSATGKFTLSGKHSCTYNSTTTNSDGETVNCYDDMVNKYLYDRSAYFNSEAREHSSDTKTNLTKVYKVIATTDSTLSYKVIVVSPNEAERVLVPTADDYGTSYYYRGDVEDNYVNFAGMCWRIVRIEGDGSVKLLLEDLSYECDNVLFTGNWSDDKQYVFGYSSEGELNFMDYTELNGLQHSFKSFQDTLSTKISEKYTGKSLSDKLKIDEWCYDDKVTATKSNEYNDEDFKYYGAYTRINTNKKPSLNCTGTKLTKFKDGTDMYVATLTADEMSFAGAGINTVGFNYSINNYLTNNYMRALAASAIDDDLYWWSISMSSTNVLGDKRAFMLSEYGYLYEEYIYNEVVDNHGQEKFYYSRPAISLKSGSLITEGVGTQSDPYVIG